MQASTYSQYIRSYLDAIPREELTHIIFWSKEQSLNIDSPSLRQAYIDATSYYHMIYNKLMTIEGSPYKNTNSLPLDEFLWAFATVSARALVMNN